MMTASAVLGSTTMYCQVEVAFSKKGKTLGVSASVLRCRVEGSAGAILFRVARDTNARLGT